jgi:hypothetical protein
MRNQIVQHLKARSQTICSTINSLNKAAHELRPPRQSIKYTDVMEMVFLAHFDLLQHSQDGRDVRNEPWADPATRALTVKYYELARAREEITRLNAEYCRLAAWMRDEKKLYLKAIEQISAQNDPLLADALQCQWAHTSLIHNINWYWLSCMRSFPSFSTSLSLGTAIRPEHINMANPRSIHEEEVSGNPEPLNIPSGAGADSSGDSNNDNAGRLVGTNGCMSDNQEFDNLVTSLGAIGV